MRISPDLLRLLTTTALLCVASEASGQKTDLLILRNGDQITGEITELSRGILSYKTDDAGTLKVKWEKVVSLTSTHNFEVELTTNRRLFGSLSEGPQPGSVRVAGEVLPLIAVVSITEISPSIVERSSGFLDLGWTLAKANNAHTVNFSGEARYRGVRIGSVLRFSFYEQGQEKADVTRRADVSMDVNRFIGPVWAARFFGTISMDDALDLELRTFVGSGARRRIIRTNRMDASWSAALVGSRERYANDDARTYSAEFLAAADFSAFRLDSPKLDATVDLSTFTSLTESNRFRADVNTRVRYEVFSDFFFALTLKSSFDNNPPSKAAAKSSYTTGLSVGWSW
jgi:hypothetical protein